MSKKYSIGLDIGTTSVGYAVIDGRFNFLRHSGKNMYGVRLFEAAETKEDRRIKRSTRRMIKRRRNRIKLLRSLLENEVLKKDENFFKRLDNSFLLLEDKDLDSNNILFADKNYTDKEYRKEFPTIYHLRKKLLDEDKKIDIRLVYLALHHIIKYRGHFLHEGANFKNSNDEVIINDLKDLIQILKDFYDNVSFSSIEVFLKILNNNQTTNRDKQRELKKLIKINCEDKEEKKKIKKSFTEITKLIVGNTADFNKIYMLDNDEKFKDSLLNEEIDEEEIEKVAGDNFYIFELIRKIYSGYMLNKIKKGNEYISEAKVEQYIKHGKDLKILKRLFRKHLNSKYNYMFNEVKDKNNKINYKEKNYFNYVGRGNCTNEELTKNIKKILKSKEEVLEKNEDYKYCMEEIKKGDFLKKLRNKENVNIPYQLHLFELEKILENQSKHYESLAKNKKKIKSILTFKIPYYVGPLNVNSEFSWITKKADEKIYPWNFEKVVDKEKCAEDFIKRMTSKCTYLFGEDVMAKKSLLQSEFEVLNELNKIRVNGEFLDLEIKEKVIEGLFKKYRSVTKKRFKDFLKNNDLYINKIEEITGFQKKDKFATSLTSYNDFNKILSDGINESNYFMIEEIIEWITIFNDNRILEHKIRNKYGDSLDDLEIKKIIKLKYSGWSRLSRKLLSKIRTKTDNEAYETIIGILRKRSLNFMQIINDNDYNFSEIIEKENNDKFEESTNLNYKIIDELKTSPANKRGIWQAILIIKEIISIVGYEPENIFIEMAREHGQKRRTKARKDNLLDLYKKIKKVKKEYNETLKELNDTKEREIKDSERLFLYFKQNGKCMYSGEPLNINELSSYHVDHIIPRSYKKDDSISNKVLVKAKENMRKKDDLLLEKRIIQSMQFKLWLPLFKSGLISRKKYKNLKRTHFHKKELEGFINRQLVETRQVTKHVMHILKEYYNDVDVRTVKARLNSILRKRYNLIKNRNVNDFHHAHDALLTCFLGMYLKNKFPNTNKYSIKNYRNYIKKMRNKKDKYGYVFNQLEDKIIDKEVGEVLFDGQEFLGKLEKYLRYKDIIISKKKEELKGEFYHQTIYKADVKSNKKIKIKSNLDPEKYGYYKSSKKAYSVIVEYDKNEKRKKEMIGVPIRISYLIKKGQKTINDFVQEKYKGLNPVILKDKIFKYQEFEQKGGKFYLASDQEAQNGRQLILDEKADEIIRMINKNYDDLNDSECLYVYNQMISKIEKYYPKYSNILDKLKNAKTDFAKIDKNTKSQIILEILRITKANGENGNFNSKELKESKLKGGRQGRLKSFSFDFNDIVFIDKSVTGLYESRSKL